MPKFDELFNKIIAEAVSSSVFDFRKQIIITVLDAERDRQVRLTPLLKVKLSTSDRIAKKSWKVLDITFIKNGDKDPRGFGYETSPIYLTRPVDRFNESGIYPRCEISIDKLSAPLKSYLRSAEIDEFGMLLKYWHVINYEAYVRQFDQIANKLGKLLFNEYQSSLEFKDFLDPLIDEIVRRDFEHKEEINRDKRAQAEF